MKFETKRMLVVARRLWRGPDSPSTAVAEWRLARWLVFGALLFKSSYIVSVLFTREIGEAYEYTFVAYCVCGYILTSDIAKRVLRMEAGAFNMAVLALCVGFILHYLAGVTVEYALSIPRDDVPITVGIISITIGSVFALVALIPFTVLYLAVSVFKFFACKPYRRSLRPAVSFVIICCALSLILSTIGLGWMLEERITRFAAMFDATKSYHCGSVVPGMGPPLIFSKSGKIFSVEFNKTIRAHRVKEFSC